MDQRGHAKCAARQDRTRPRDGPAARRSLQSARAAGSIRGAQLRPRRSMVHPCAAGMAAAQHHQRIAAASGRHEEDQDAREITTWRGEIHARSEGGTPAAPPRVGQGGAAERWSRSAPDGATWRACARSTHETPPPFPLCAGNAQAAAKLPTAPARCVTAMAGCPGRNAAVESEVKGVLGSSPPLFLSFAGDLSS